MRRWIQMLKERRNMGRDSQRKVILEYPTKDELRKQIKDSFRSRRFPASFPPANYTKANAIQKVEQGTGQQIASGIA
jgi:hypothetical protein